MLVYYSIITKFNQINISQLDPALAGLVEKGLADLDSLTELEKCQFGWIMRVYVNIWENMYQQYLEGACPESYWLPYAEQARTALDMPGGKTYRAGNTLNEGLFTYLDGLSIKAPDFDLSLKERVRQ